MRVVVYNRSLKKIAIENYAEKDSELWKKKKKIEENSSLIDCQLAGNFLFSSGNT